jgi:EmrB/QacA subfamily drug resistance transporter
MSTAVAAPRGANLSHRQIQIVFLGLMAGMLVAALDQTIVATALPTIVGELGGLSHLSWVVTAYLLTSTVSVPLYGKVSDLLGRKVVFQAAIIIFVIGSILSGFSQNMLELILFRAVQGIGAGGLISMAQAIIGDIVAPRDRGKYQGYLGAVFAFASVVGPLLGGFFVDHLSWRWVFYVNVPVGGIALAITAVVLNVPFRKIDHAIDYLGASLIGAAATCLLLVTVWGGNEFAWGSGVIIGLAVAGVVLLALFILQERRADEPVIPLRLWNDKVFSVASGLEFLVGFAMFGGIIYLPLWLQTVGGASAQNSGLLILPLMAGLMVSSITSGRLITKNGRYKRYPVIGTATIAAGMFLLSTMDVGTSRWTSSAYMVVLGLGLGMIIQIMVLAVQNSVPHSDLGTATATETFTRSMGGAFGVAVFGAILTNRLVYNLHRLLPARSRQLDLSSITGSPAAIRALPATTQRAVIQALASSIHVLFLAAVPLALLAFVVTWFLPEKPLRQTAHIGVEGVGEELLVGLGQTPDTPVELADQPRGDAAPTVT